MTSTVAQWEVVGKHKLNTSSSGKLTKEQQKKIIEKFPKLEDLPPLKESQTLYEAFNEKKKKIEDNNKKHENGKLPKSPSNASKKKNIEKKKKPEQKTLFKTMTEAANNLDKSEMQTLVDASIDRFPDAPMIWLKDFATYLNVKLATVNEHDNPVFSNKPIGYPLNCMPKFLKNNLSSVIKKCSSFTITSFYEHCLLSMAENMIQGIPATGYRIFIQYLSQEKPCITSNSLEKLNSLIKKYSNRNKVCLAIMWAAGESGFKNFKDGLKVWLNVMYPMIGLKSYSKYVIDYLIALYSKHSDVKCGSEILGVEEFFSIVDFMFNNVTLVPNLHKQFRELYPKIKETSFGKNPKTVLHQFFPSFLQRLNSGSSKMLRKEVLDCLVLCLECDKHTYSVWRQLYTKHLLQSSILLEHILSTWNLRSQTLKHIMFKETLSAFHVTNTELGNNESGVTKCNKVIENLFNKMNETKVPWKFFCFVFLAVIIGLLAYDVNLNGDFKKSRTGRLLKESGILVVLQQAWNRINVYSKVGMKWLHDNLPVYFNTINDTCKPYILSAYQKVSEVCLFLFDYTADARIWLSKQVENTFIWIDKQAPGAYNKFISISSNIYTYVHEMSLIILTHLHNYYMFVSSWIQKNVLSDDFNVEKMQKVFVNSIAGFQDFMVQGYSWVLVQVKSVTG